MDIYNKLLYNERVQRFIIDNIDKIARRGRACEKKSVNLKPSVVKYN